MVFILSGRNKSTGKGGKLPPRDNDIIDTDLLSFLFEQRVQSLCKILVCKNSFDKAVIRLLVCF